MAANRAEFEHTGRIIHALISRSPPAAFYVGINTVTQVPLLKKRDVADRLWLPGVAKAACFWTKLSIV